MSEDQDKIPASNSAENQPETSSIPADDLRYAPPVEPAAVAESHEEISAPSNTEILDSPAEENVLDIDEAGLTVSDELDIEAALAAVSNLSDLVAEQEAAEQTRIAQEAAAAQLQVERQARLDYPERFFPVPPLTTIYRGQMASFIPAVLLILVGAWLTFTLTTTKTLPDTGLLLLIAGAGLALTLIVRWLASGRWARGSLFFAMVLLFCGITGGYLLQPGSPGLASGWPLLILALGLAVIITALLSRPVERRLIFPGVVLMIVGGAGLVVTLNVLSASLLATVASLWPVAVVIILILWLIPVIVRQRP